MKEIIDLKEKEFLSVIQLAKILKISRVAVLKRINRGVIKAIKVGRSFIIKSKDVQHLFNK